MTRTATKSQLMNYLVDCKGYSEDEAKEMISQDNYEDVMSDSDWDACMEFSK